MSSTAPSKRDHEPNTLASGKGIFDWVTDFLTTTIGSKVLVALTGSGLTLFVIAHLIGNLKLLAGQDAINDYAKFLKELGPLLWIARIGLLTIFILHVTLAIRLKRRSAKARPVSYKYPATIQATTASKTMLSTGAVVGIFVVFHLAHFTFGWVTTTQAVDMASKTQQRVETKYSNLVDTKGRHDVYSMVVAGFKNPLISTLYILAQLMLLVHLSHGIRSVFQTLGLNTPRFQRFFTSAAWMIAGLIAAGNVTIVVIVWAGLVPELTPFTTTAPG